MQIHSKNNKITLKISQAEWMNIGREKGWINNWGDEKAYNTFVEILNKNPGIITLLNKSGYQINPKPVAHLQELNKLIMMVIGSKQWWDKYLNTNQQKELDRACFKFSQFVDKAFEGA